MSKGAITQYIDVAQILLYVFWFFFAGLIYYLRREDKREGYPLVYEGDENQPYLNFPPIPKPKTFLMPDGREIQAPRPEVERPEPKLASTDPWQGAPLNPTGDPMLDAVGPGSYAMREDVPDRTIEGDPKIVPLRILKDFAVAAKDVDPRGMDVVGADDVVAGQVSEIWVDRSDSLVRYLEVNLGGTPAKRVLLPIYFADVNGAEDLVRVDAILGSQFANVPTLSKPDQVTFLEEERISAYYGGGTLYATPERADPLI